MNFKEETQKGKKADADPVKEVTNRWANRESVNNRRYKKGEANYKAYLV